MTDPISDMLARIRNAIMVKKPDVVVPYSNIKASLAKILEKEGYVDNISEINAPFRSLQLKLKYHNGEPSIRNLKRVSKPGRRQYAKSTELPYVQSNMGIAIISTSHGLMTNKDARQKKLGGEVICEIY